MALKCGIVGLPNVGKSTLFNCLSNAKAQSANFPFCTIEPNMGVITVPDPRLNKLAELVNPQQVLPTTVEIVDIAGLVKGASKGEGLGNKFLGNIRETDAILHVLRVLTTATWCTWMALLTRARQGCDRHGAPAQRPRDRRGTHGQSERAAKSGDKEQKKIYDVPVRIKEALEAGTSARALDYEAPEVAIVKDLQLITSKPVMYVCNVDEGSVVDGNAHVQAVRDAVKDELAEVLIIGAGIEADIAELDDAEEREMFLADVGLEEPGVAKLIRQAYALLQLQTYFTAGEKEVRAWTVKVGSTAPEAAGVIHTDFQKGFIRAEVIAYNDYVEYGSESAVKDAGKMRVEGKEYLVKDGDVMHFRFNV